MKLFQIVSFLATIVSLMNIAAAQLNYYGVDANIDPGGQAEIRLTLTFKEPAEKFTTTVIGRVNNFTASSNAGPVDCKVEVRGTSSIDCDLNLTKEKRTVTISYKTPDFVKDLDDKFFFSSDFSINADIDRVFATMKLPERMAKVEGSSVSFPNQVDVLSGGNVIVWSLNDLRKTDSIKLDVLYEKLPLSFLEQVTTSKLLLSVLTFAIVVGTVIAFIMLRYFRRSEQLVLSVLDEFERKVVDVIAANQGEVNQRKVVQDTNLSKAKISRVVKSLTERGVIEVQRLGRTNKLKLVKKKLTP